jgi:hypothetical protein
VELEGQGQPQYGGRVEGHERHRDALQHRGQTRGHPGQQIEDFDAYLEGVLKQSFQYVFMSKGTLVDVFDGAKITQGESSIDVAASDIFVKGDKLNMSVDPASKLATKLNFTTTLEDDTITGVVTMAAIDKGPSKPTRIEIDVPTQSIKIVSETYDWIEQK